MAMIMTTPPTSQAGRIASGAGASSERLAFNDGPGTVPAQQLIDAALAADASPTFATAPYAEPRDWGYVGLLAFTAVLLLRPQDQIPGLDLAAPRRDLRLRRHRADAAAPLRAASAGVPHHAGNARADRASASSSSPRRRSRSGPAAPSSVFFDSYLKIVIVFVLMMNTLTTPKRLEQLTWLILLLLRLHRVPRGVRLRARREPRRGRTRRRRGQRHLRQSERPRAEHGDLHAGGADGRVDARGTPRSGG